MVADAVRMDAYREALRRTVTPESVVLDMLRLNPRPDMAIAGGTPAGLPVHWKTGTSNGFRDAWTVGIFGPEHLPIRFTPT